MSATVTPRLSGGMVASFVLHSGVIAALFILRPGAARPSAPVYRVQILAAPAGERAAGVVRDRATPPPVVPEPIPAATKPAPTPKKLAPKAKAKPSAPPQLATPSPVRPTKAAEPPKPAALAPTAGGGETGGAGADVATVVTNGIEFPYPPYINNITSQIIRRFHTTARLVAEVRFVIRRDGTVDPDGIRLVTSSHVYAFDQAALGAVEAAATANQFGPLPPGFREDILPVTFRFTPALFR